MKLKQTLRVVVVALTVACGNPGTGPNSDEDPGFVRVSVSGPATPAVAFKIRITGGSLDSARVSGGTLYFETLGPTLHRAVVVDSPDRTRLVEFWVPDRNTLDTWGVNVEEVANAETYAQLSVSPYVATVGR